MARAPHRRAVRPAGIILIFGSIAANGASIAICVAVLTAAPLVIVVGYETLGHRHQAAALDALLGPVLR